MRLLFSVGILFGISFTLASGFSTQSGCSVLSSFDSRVSWVWELKSVHGESDNHVDDCLKKTPWTTHFRNGCMSFGEGVSDVSIRYWSHTARQCSVGLLASAVTVRLCGSKAFQPLLQFLESIARSDWMYEYLSTEIRAMERVAAFFGGQRLAFSLVGSPIVEEVLYRQCLFKLLKYLLRRPSQTGKGAKNRRIWTSYSVITSLAFALNHIDVSVMSHAQQLSSSIEGRLLIARNTKHMVEAFFGGMFIMNPLMEGRGILAAVGAHSAWNTAVNVAPVHAMLMKVHLIHRFLGGYSLSWRLAPLQKIADILLYAIGVRYAFEVGRKSVDIDW